MPQENFIIIDGNSLAHRAYHAVQPLSTSRGLITNAVYGFTNMLFKIIKEQSPDLIAVAFDKGKVTFRHDAYNEYKAHRSATPEDLRPQFPIMKDILKAMRIPAFEIEGFEADDLIGTLTAQAEQSGINSMVVTGDRDVMQLVSPLTRVMLTKKGISQLEAYDEGGVWDRYGVTPRQYTDFRGLTGDVSDNIPGIPGIGEKTASRLLKEYGSLEEILARAEEITGRAGRQLRNYGHQAELAKRLVTIHRTVPVEINLEQCRWRGPDYRELLAVFQELEFNSLIKALYLGKNQANDTKQPVKSKNRKPKNNRQALPEPDLETCPVDYRELDTPARINKFLGDARKAGRTALAISSRAPDAILAAGFAPGEELAYRTGYPEPAPEEDTAENYPDKNITPLPAGELTKPTLALLKEICTATDIKKYCHNGKNIIGLLHRYGISLNHLAFDTMIAAYLLNPASPNRELEDICLEHLGTVLPGGEAELPARAHCIMQLTRLLDEKLKLFEQDRLYYEVELPLVQILADMETEGVAVDRNQLEAMSVQLGRSMKNLAGDIYRLAGQEFNLNSPKQLGKILFEELKLPVIKKTKTGYSTDAAVLEELAAAHEIAAKILEYRQFMKLKSTYTDGLAALINPVTGRLHTTFHQAVTATGRLSSAEPNLQNIPVRLEPGRQIRKMFIPGSKEHLLLSADYSQIELRILAHISGDPVLINAFRNGEDIHTRTAAEVFGVLPEKVTREMRGRAKAVNFGIVYGLSDYGLSRDIKVTRGEARRYIENYFARYAGVKTYIDRVVREAREKGYVTTLLNRRRYLPDLFSPNRTVRNFGERTAMNTPIQGSAADIIKLAMVNIRREMDAHGFKAKMILQVHDELIFDSPADEIDRLAALVMRCMENVLALNVPLVADVKVGPNWYDVKKIKVRESI